MPDDSPPQTPEVLSSDETIYRLIEETFTETWEDYYRNKPPSTLPLINGNLGKCALEINTEVIGRHQALSEELRRIVEEEEKYHTGVEKSGDDQQCTMSDTDGFIGSSDSTLIDSRITSSSRCIGSSNDTSSNIVKKRKRSPSSSLSSSKQYKEGKFQITSTPNDIKPIPPYLFCISGNANLARDDERSMPFIPIFNDDSEFNQDAHSRNFGGRVGWEGLWRDPEVDIIQVEALSRIRRKTNYEITSEQIDETLILPSKVIRIENLDLSRDLPPFPIIPLQHPVDDNQSNDGNSRESISSNRGWYQPFPIPRYSGKGGINEFGEDFCPRSGCTMFACPRHATFENDQFIFQSASQRQHPTIQPFIPRRIIKVLQNTAHNPPCANDCYRSYTKEELRDEVAANEWQFEDEEDMNLLIERMSSVEEEITGRDLCLLSLLSDGYTCKEVAMRILSLALKDPTEDTEGLSPGSDSGGDKLSATGFKVETLSPIPGLAEPSNVPDFRECDHPGPCSAADCGCFVNGWTCGRNCICPTSCVRRNQGCQCHRILTQEGHRKVEGSCVQGDCPCAIANRECDPELCGPCGAEGDIQSARRYLRSFMKDTYQETNSQGDVNNTISNECGNVDLQKGIWPKLRVGISPVSGYGLFAEEDIGEDCFSGEYVGEVISHAEGVRRDQINDQIGRHYIFNLNSESVIDSGNYGNITRYINSAKGDAVNIIAKNVVVNNETRIIFRSIRPIDKGEEFRFDYGDAFNEHAIDKRKETHAFTG